MTREEYRNRKGRSSSWITRQRRLAIYIRDAFTCQYCGMDLRDASPRNVTLDHLKPRSQGGTHHTANLVTACLSCNSARSDLVRWYAYATPGAVERIRRTIRRVPNIALAKSILAGRTTEGK